MYSRGCRRRSCRRAVPGGWKLFQQDDEWTAQMAQQLPEKPANFLLPDIVEVKLIVRPRCCRRGLTEIPEMTETLSRRPWR